MICERGESSICILGSLLGSVERTNKRRPSKDCALLSAGNVTENDCAAARVKGFNRNRNGKMRARALRFMDDTIQGRAGRATSDNQNLGLLRASATEARLSLRSLRPITANLSAIVK